MRCKEFLVDVCGNIIAKWRIKLYDVTFPCFSSGNCISNKICQQGDNEFCHYSHYCIRLDDYIQVRLGRKFFLLGAVNKGRPHKITKNWLLPPFSEKCTHWLYPPWLCGHTINFEKFDVFAPKILRPHLKTLTPLFKKYLHWTNPLLMTADVLYGQPLVRRNFGDSFADCSGKLFLDGGGWLDLALIYKGLS